MVLRKWVCSWVIRTLQTSLVRFFRVRSTRGQLRSPKRMVAFFGRSPCEDDERSCGVTLFADDVFEKSLLEKCTADECELTVVRRMVDVNSALETCGLRQNAGKLVILPNLRRTVENRRFSRSKHEYQIKTSRRFLGIVYPAMLSMGAEIGQRIWATNRACRELYGMWWNKRVPYKIKRIFFRGAVPHCTSPSRPRLPSFAEVLGEKAPRAHAQNGLMGRTRPQRTLSSRQVWKRWRLAPPAYELCVQRLRWYQSIAREPARHAHLCCWFGRMHFESHDTLIDGLRLHPEAHGYAKRLLADLQTLAFVPELAEQVANVELEFGDVFRLGSTQGARRKVFSAFTRWI